jgi:serine/threonine protein kinase
MSDIHTLACGATACAFDTIPESCQNLVDPRNSSNIIRLPKTRKGSTVKSHNKMKSIDDDELFSLHNQHICMLDYPTYVNYMKAAHESDHMMSAVTFIGYPGTNITDPVMTTIQRNGGIAFDKIPDTNEKYRLLGNVLYGIGVMNDNMLFHLDIHPQNIVVDDENVARIIDFETAIDIHDNKPDEISTVILYSHPDTMNHYYPRLVGQADVVLARTKPLDYIKKFRLYIDMTAFVELLDKISNDNVLPIIIHKNIRKFILEVQSASLDAIKALPVYIKIFGDYTTVRASTIHPSWPMPPGTNESWPMPPGM